MRYLPPEAQTINRRLYPIAKYEGKITVIELALMSAFMSAPDAPLSGRLWLIAKQNRHTAISSYG